MNIIVSVDKKNGIGFKDKLLYNFAKSKDYFDKKTINKVVVMGRKTFENLLNKKPLEKRINICLTRDKNYKANGVVVVNSIKDLFERLCFYNTDNVFVIGGNSIFKQLLPYCKNCYVTKVDDTKTADTFFSDLDNDKFWKMVENTDPYFEDNIIYYICKYENKKIMKYNFGYDEEYLF